MKKVWLVAIVVMLQSAITALADSPLKEGDYTWISNIRNEHPRMFLTEDDLPKIREAAFSFEAEAYKRLKKRIDTRLGKPVVFDDPLVSTGESNQNRNWGYYASDAAMLWLITQDRVYLDFTKTILHELIDYYHLRVDNNLNIEWYALSQICAMCAYDWIYNDLTDQERNHYGRDLYEALCAIAWHGPGLRKARFRENVGDYTSGCYGTPVLPWYIGLTFWNDGIDDGFCEKMVRNGYDLHQKMTDHRARMFGENGGGGSSGVPWYSLGYYPFAEYDFIYTFRSAVGVDIAKQLDYLVGYLNYMDWIRLPGNKEYGTGDSSHTNCSLPAYYINSHVYEIANLYGEYYPEILPKAARLLTMFNRRGGMDPIPFIRLLHKTDIHSYEAEDISGSQHPKSMYFDTMGQFYMRSGTEDSDTYALFMSGGITHRHKHFDNNNFIIYKHGYRALDSGSRPEPGWHLPYYFARTVAHNCITIRMPGEVLPKYWGGPSAVEEKNIPIPNDGGQCDALGSKILKVEETSDYVYLASDASECYHADKSELVVREFVWCVPDVFVIFDRVISDKAEYAKRWLYHTAAEPEFKGNLEFSEKSQGGKSICRTLFPKDAQLEKIGGPGKQFWSDGRNWPIPEMSPEDFGYAKKSIFPSNDHPLVGQWRVEVTPGSERTHDIFMHILQVGGEELESLPVTKTFENKNTVGVRFKYNGKKYRIAFDKRADYGCKIDVTY